MAINLKLYNYRTSGSLKTNWPDNLNGYNLFIYKPKLFSLSKYGQGFLRNLLWYIFTMGKYRILFLTDANLIIHFTYLTPKMFRFPFMKRRDLQIGPCETIPEYQRKGIYSSVLKLVLEVCAKSERSIWIYTAPNNLASQKAIVKSGFKFYSEITMSGITKRMRVNKTT